MLMKTVFKKGMKVYDQLIFPDKEGIVLTTNYIPEKIFDEDDFDENYVHLYPIEVEFGQETMLYTSDGDSGMCGLKTLSTKPYKVEFQGFEQKEPVPTFEEAEDWVKREFAKGNIFLMSKDVLEALRRLVILRDYYNEGWRPQNNSYVHIITTRNGELVNDCLMGDFRVLYFKSVEIRNTFFKEQKELLEIAKPLL
jgi:hypothetical protein